MEIMHQKSNRLNTISHLYTFSGLGHDDLTGNFGAPHIFSHQVIDAHILKATNAGCRAFFDQRGCATNRIGINCACFCRVYNDGVRAGEVLQMEPYGVLGCFFNERVILGLVCADLDGVSVVENFGVHGGCPTINAPQFKSIFDALI